MFSRLRTALRSRFMPLKIWANSRRTSASRVSWTRGVCSRSLRKNNRVPKKKTKETETRNRRSGPVWTRKLEKKKSKTGSRHGPRVFGMKRKTEIKPEPVRNRESFRRPCWPARTARTSAIWNRCYSPYWTKYDILTEPVMAADISDIVSYGTDGEQIASTSLYSNHNMNTHARPHGHRHGHTYTV